MMTPFHRAAAFSLLSMLLAAPAAASSWDVVAVNAAPVTGTPTIEFTPDGGLSGSTGCNRFIASASLSGTELVLAGPLAMTRMACPGDGLTEQENTFVRILEGTVGMQFDPFTQTLVLSRDGLSLTLKATHSHDD